LITFNYQITLIEAKLEQQPISIEQFTEE
jgi:hypothetical protein